MAALKWLPEAIDDMRRLHEFLYAKNQTAAVNCTKLIIKGTQLLEKSPNLGRPIDDNTGRRELFMSFGSSAYVIRYKTSGTDVIIIRIWHNREDWK